MYLKRTFKILNIKALVKCTNKRIAESSGQMPLVHLVAIKVTACECACMCVCEGAYSLALKLTEEGCSLLQKLIPSEERICQLCLFCPVTCGFDGGRSICRYQFVGHS